MDSQQAKRIIEALLFVSDQPVSVRRFKEVLGESDPQMFRALLQQLNDEYLQSQRAFRIQEVAGGYQLVTDPQLAAWIKRALELPRESALSKAALETLAIIAYRQPLTKAEIEAIRGVDVTATLETLMERQFVRITGRKETPGRPLLYGTTAEFLQHVGLKSLDELPPMAPEARPTLPLMPTEAGQGGTTLAPASSEVALATSEAEATTQQPTTAGSDAQEERHQGDPQPTSQAD